MSLGIKKSGKYEVELYAQLTEGEPFEKLVHYNIDDPNITSGGELVLTRYKVGGGAHDGHVEKIYLYATGFWSAATFKLQEEEGSE